MQHTEPPAVERSLALYLALLRAYPPAFRERYGHEMALAFRDAARDALCQSGLFGLIALWARTLSDTVVNATRERCRARQLEIILDRTFALVVDRVLVLLILGILCFYIAPFARFCDSWHLPISGWNYGGGHRFPKMTFIFVCGLPSISWAGGIALWVVGGVVLFNATLGMRLVGLRIAAVDGSPLRWPRILLWHFASYISLLAFGLGYLWVLIDPEGRTWHDIVAGVRVSLTSEVTERRGALA